jgi:hypothetical protein
MRELIKIEQPQPASGCSIPAAFAWLKRNRDIAKLAEKLKLNNPLLIEFAYFMQIYLNVVCASKYSLLPDEIEQVIQSEIGQAKLDNAYLCAVLTRADGSGAILLCTDGADSPNLVLIDTENDNAIQCENMHDLIGLFGEIYAIAFEYCAIRNKPKQYDTFILSHILGEPNQPMAASD